MTGGGSETYDIGENTIIPYLLNRGIKSIDYIICSHFDTDHVGGLKSVLKNLKVKNGTITTQEITVGAVAAVNNGKIENCSSEGMIFKNLKTGNPITEVGGICGKSYGIVRSCLNKSNISNNGQGRRNSWCRRWTNNILL